MSIIVSTGVTSTGRIVEDDEMYVYSKGTANSTTVKSNGTMYIEGGMANKTTLSGFYSYYDASYGQMYISSGGTANSTTVNSGGCLNVHEGIASKTTLNFGGWMLVYEMAEYTTINSGGSVSVVGGTVFNTTVNNAGRVEILNSGTAIYTIISSGGNMVVYRDGTAIGAEVNSGGKMTVSSGGTASDTTIFNNGSMYLYGGSVIEGETNVSGTIYVEGTMVNNGNITLNLASKAQIRNLNYMSGTNNFTVNTASVSMGDFTLADGARNYNGTVTICNNNTELGTISVGGSFEKDGTKYSLTKNSDVLSLAINTQTTGDQVKLYSKGSLVSSATVMTGKNVSSGGKMYVSSGGTANSTTINSSGYMDVYSGGTANSTTVNSSGWFEIYGGTVNSTIVNSKGCMHVWENGTANRTTVNFSGLIDVDNGTANSTTVNSGGTMSIFNGAMTYNTILKSGGTMHVWESTASNTVISGGEMHVNSGTANSTTVNSGGLLNVMSGGTANYVVWTPCVGQVYVADGAVVTYASRYSGVYFGRDDTLHSTATVMSNKTVSGWNCSMYVMSGGTANRTTVSEIADLYVSSGGTVNSTTVNSRGHLCVSSGGIANNTTVNEVGWLNVKSGGTVNSTTVKSNGELWLFDGGTLSGTLQITSGALVSACQGANIDFTVAEQTSPSSALINDWSLITGGSDADYTITVNAGQANGTYVLADGAANFDKSVTVKTSNGTKLGTLSVGGSFGKDGTKYSLTKNSDVLSLAINTQTTGDQVKLYYDWTLVSSATVMTGKNVSSGGYMEVSSGGTANNTTIFGSFSSYDWEGMTHMEVSSGGTANSTTVNSGGWLNVMSGGTANSTTVNSGGLLNVMSGGTANYVVWTPCVGQVYVEDGAVVTYASRYSGVYFGRDDTLHSTATVMSNKTVSGWNCSMYVMSGGTANRTTVSEIAGLYVLRGGTVNSTTVNSRGDLRVSSGGIANNTTVNEVGWLNVMSGGTVNSTTVKSNGELWLFDGGTLSGTLQITSGALVSACQGACIDFTVAEQTSSSTALINDWSLIQGGLDASYSITVNSNQANGTYKLASNASGFTGSMSVKTDDSTLIQSLTIDGEAVTVNEVSYALKHDASNLVLAITGKPVVELDWTWNINANGKLEVATESGYTVSYATVSEPATWTPYTTPLNPITGTYYFKAENGISTAKNEIVGYVGQYAARGGAIYNTGSRTLGNAYFLRNSAGSSGGAIYNNSNAGMTLSSATFSGNSAGAGGAIYNSGSMTLSSATFTGNSAWDGGAIKNEESMTLSNATFCMNSADAQGGAIHNKKFLALNDITFASNSANGNGGALHNGNEIILEKITFVKNSANGGGAISIWNGNAILTDVQFNGNSAGCGIYNMGGGGAIYNNNGSMTLSSATFTGNSASDNNGGAIYNVNGSMTLSSATFSGNSAKYGGAIYNWYGGRITLNSATFNGNSAQNGGAIFNDENCTITLNNAKFETVSDTIYNVGSMTFVGLVSLAANLYTTTAITATDAILMFDISSYKAANETVIVSDISKIDGADYAICVDADQTYASYILAGNANNFAETITIKNTAGNEVGTISVGDTLKVEDTIYKLNVSDSNLVFTVSSATTDETAPILSGWQVRDTVFASAMDSSQVAFLQYKVDGAANWKTYNASTGVKVTSDNGQVMFRATDTMGNSSDILLNINQNLLPSASDVVTVGAQQIHWDLSNDEQHSAKVTIQDEEKTLSFNTKDENVSILGGGGMQISVADSTGKSLGKLDLESTIPADAEDKPVEMDAGEADGVTDIFIARTNGIWEKGYAAMHFGYLQAGQLHAGTSEYVELQGRNKICDIFNGAEDANILLLTDDSNGDSLFVEDVYSESTGDLGKTQSRIAQIKEIYAGAGNDIIDMTSQQFEYTGEGITVHGGSGDDTIWATHGDNKLFGDTGNDRIVGASGNDVIAGGAGNDSMHGGGGSDIFCFCKDWGTDTVEQLADGTVTLWFESGSASKWDQQSMTYTDGDNTVTVSGVTVVTLKFGDDQSDLYKELVSLDAFADKTSEKIFEDKDKSLATTVK